ncbi:hypothetical protein ABPG74_010661 [Tetrahymena malaccensis]
MACLQVRNGEQSMFGDSNKLQSNQLRAFGREIQNIPDSRFNTRSQSIKANMQPHHAQKLSMELDTNINEQENGMKRSSPRKFSMHVKHSSEVPQNHQKRMSSQIDTVSNNGTERSYQPNQAGLQNKYIDMKNIEFELNRISKEDSEKPTLVAQYSKQIFDYMRQREIAFKVGEYMEKQTQINDRMRSILIDWIVEIHRKCKLLPETLFITVNLIDRFLDRATCSRENLQLVGVTALFIASKYEEIYPPNLNDFVEATQKAYRKNDVLQMEGSIICALNFNLTVPTSLRFLERYGRVDKLDKKSFDMSLYILQLCLVEYKFVKYSESLKACAAIYLTNKLFKKNICWSDVLSGHSQHTEQQIRPCALEMCMLLQSASTNQTQAVRRKFLSSEFSEVATIQIEKLNPSQQNSQQHSYQNNQNYPPNIPKYNYREQY